MDLLDLRKLSDLDFESLCKDIFERILDVRLEIFASGPDGGVDLRYLGPDRNIVIQCKHWMKSGRDKLIRHLLNSELPKLDQIQPLPMRYVLATSVELTPFAKDKILDGFRPYIQSTGDILGISEITSFLQSNPDIVRKHMRLWLNDSTILDSMISKNVILRSFHLADDIKETLRTYVPSSNLRNAMNLVEDNHVVLLSGPPGVGKTTLAHVLCAHYADRGFEVVEVSENVEDVYRVWHDGEPQVFVYDDFLGQTSLDDKLHKNEDSRLLSLIRRIRKDPSKRFICTTREYVLRQARQRYERLDRGDLDPLTFTVDLGALTSEEKAQILHNHIYWSNWPTVAKRDFSRPEIYRTIIGHNSFNPRAISNLVSVPFDPDLGEPGEQAVAALDDPMGLWSHVFDHQLKDSERDILYLLFSLGGKRAKADLEDAYLSFAASSSSRFKASLKVLDGTLVRVTGDRSREYVEFSNPSVNDFMLMKFSDERDLVTRVLRNPYSFDQVALLWSYGNAPGKAKLPGEIDLALFEANIDKAGAATLDRENTTAMTKSRRAVICLDIASSLNVPSLESWAIQRVSNSGFVYRAEASDVISLMQVTRNCANERIRKLHDSVRLEGLTSLFNRERDEHGLFVAASYAMDLAGFVDPKIRKGLCRKANEAFDRVLGEYIHSRNPDVDPDMMVHGLEYILRYDEEWWQNRWPEAADILDDWLPERVEIDEESFLSDADPEYVDGEVFLIMNALAYLE